MTSLTDLINPGVAIINHHFQIMGHWRSSEVSWRNEAIFRG